MHVARQDSLLELIEQCKQRNATKEEIAAVMKRHIEFKARDRGVPLRGTFELTPLCNLNCQMCYVHLTKEQFDNQHCDLLNGEQWKNIIQQAVNMGMIEATLTGGEALLHPDFQDIFDCLVSNNVYVNLKSNGILLTEERIRYLKERNISSIQISLYGCDEDIYERVTGRRVFSRVMAAIEDVRRYNIPLEIVITPSQYMWNSIDALLRMVDSMDIPYSVNPGLVDPLEETGRSGVDHDLTLDQYIDLYKMRLALKGKSEPQQCIEEIPAPGGGITQEVQGLRCAAGRSVFSVTWRGRVHPCRMLEKIGYNGLNMQFAEIWAKINAEVKAYPFPKECIGCQYELVCPSCVIQHERGAELGHANPSICQRAQRMAREGFFTTDRNSIVVGG